MNIFSGPILIKQLEQLINFYIICDLIVTKIALHQSYVYSAALLKSCFYTLVHLSGKVISSGLSDYSFPG